MILGRTVTTGSHGLQPSNSPPWNIYAVNLSALSMFPPEFKEFIER
jgi:hypothetical protein